MITSEQSRNAVVVAERFADGEATGEELQAAEEKANASWLENAADDARFACHHVCKKDLVGRQVNHAAHASTSAIAALFKQQQLAANKPVEPLGGRWRGDCPLEERGQCDLLRDIFGNPFRPVAVDPRWLTSDVVALARSIYDDRAFDRMPILADALQDAGCDHPDVLAHCRSEGPHVRGCWVVDLLLGKE